MDRGRLVIPLGILLALMVAAASYLGVSALLTAEAGGRREAAGRLEIDRRLAALERRLAELEKRPGLSEQLDEEEVRQKLADAMASLRETERETEERRRNEERTASAVRAYRWAYDQMLSGARTAIGVDDEAWNDLQPVFARHFEPVAARVREVATGGAGRRWGTTRVDIGDTVAAVLPETVAELQRRLPEKSWAAFDEWRRQGEAGRFGPALRAEYFLPAGEVAALRTAAATERRWRHVERALPALVDELKLPPDAAAKLETVLKQHVDRFTAALAGREYWNPNDEGVRAAILQVSKATDEGVRKLLDEPGFAAYEEWKRRADTGVSVYFGQGGDWPGRRVRPGRPQEDDTPEAPAPDPLGRPGEMF